MEGVTLPLGAELRPANGALWAVVVFFGMWGPERRLWGFWSEKPASTDRQLLVRSFHAYLWLLVVSFPVLALPRVLNPHRVFTQGRFAPGAKESGLGI